MNEVLPKAHEAVAKALELDSNLGEAHSSLALVRIVEQNLLGAEESYEMSIKLDPDNSVSHHGYSYLLSWLDKNSKAIKEAKRALELEPINPVMSRGLGYVYYLNRNFDLAITEYMKSLEIDSNQIIAYQWLSWAYHSKMMYEEAISALANYLIVLNKEDIALKIKSTFSESGYTNAIKQLIDISKKQSISNISGPYWNSVLYAMIGEIDEAFESLIHQEFSKIQ